MCGVGFEGAVAGKRADIGIAVGDGGFQGQVTVGAAAAIDAAGPGDELAVGEGCNRAPGEDGANVNLDDVGGVKRKTGQDGEQKDAKSSSGHGGLY